MEFYFGTRLSSVPAADPTASTFEVLLSRLQEAHELSVYASIERLVQAGEAVGLDVDALIRLLDRGKTLEDLLELVESKMEHLQKVA